MDIDNNTIMDTRTDNCWIADIDTLGSRPILVSERRRTIVKGEKMYIDSLKWEKFLMNIERINMCRLGKDLDITYGHLFKLKAAFIDLGWVNTDKQGREHRITLTATGKEMVETLKTKHRIIEESMAKAKEKNK